MGGEGGTAAVGHVRGLVLTKSINFKLEAAQLLSSRQAHRQKPNWPRHAPGGGGGEEGRGGYIAPLRESSLHAVTTAADRPDVPERACRRGYIHIAHCHLAAGGPVMQAVTLTPAFDGSAVNYYKTIYGSKSIPSFV